MDFRFTEDQQDLIDAAKAFFDGENTVERMRAMVNETYTGPTLWGKLSELGLIGIMAKESNGGLGQSLALMSAIAEAAGYSGLCEHYVDVAGIAVPLLEDLNELEALSSVMNCEDVIGIISPLAQHINYANVSSLYLRTNEKGGNLSSEKTESFEIIWSIDPLRLIHKTRDVGQQNKLADYHGAVLTAAQLIGLSQRMVDMSVEYAKDRHQFGKPIGSFQAVKHHLANVYTQIEFTRPIIHLAAIKGGVAVHNAKVAAIDTAMLAAETAIQVHGGMGYTYEVDLHLFMKRAWALCGEWGDRNYHMKKLEDYILNGDAELGPGKTFT